MTSPAAPLTAPEAAPSLKLKGAVAWEPGLGVHVPALDGIRGLAILLVMAFHLTVMTSNTRADHVWRAIVGYGAGGVDLFFVLSGFLITGILYDSKQSNHYFRNFYARRILRIFPLYYAVVFVSLVVLPHIHHPKAASFGRISGDELWYWLYLSNFSIAARAAWRHGILDVTWSLAIEEQFYLLWPAIVLLLSRRALMRLCVGLIVIAIAFRSGLVLNGKTYIAVLTLTPSRFDALAIGAWIALAARAPAGPRALLPLAKWAGFIGAAFLLMVVGNPTSWEVGRTGQLGQCFGFTAEACVYGALLTAAIALPPKATVVRGLRMGWLRTFGKYSYALYLFHLPIRAAVRDLFYGPGRFPVVGGSQLPGQLIFYFIAGALSLIAAVLSWHVYEKHFLRLKPHFR